MKPHGRDCPDRCSMCRGATPRIVTVIGAEVRIDGELVDRSVIPESSMETHYARRGGRAHHARRTKP